MESKPMKSSEKQAGGIMLLVMATMFLCSLMLSGALIFAALILA